jgi:hypothetical protein
LKVFDLIKNKIALAIVEKAVKSRQETNRPIADFFKKSFTFLILMPEDELDFQRSFEVLRFLDQHRKHITIFTNDFRINLLPPNFRSRAIDFSIEDRNKFNIPTKQLISRLNEISVNAVMDLNRQENLFFSYSANMVNSFYRIGFIKTDSDKFYNIQIGNDGESAELSYKNFLNCLQMF